MSFREKDPRYPSKFSSLKRSLSFGGFLNSKSLSSPTPSGSTVLGSRTPNTTKKLLAGGTGGGSGFGISFSSHKKTKVPKVPRPQRVLMIFEHVKSGIHQCIKVTTADVENMKATEGLSTSSTGQAKILEIEKQVKAAERYRKKLEFHLSKVEELEENYKLQQQLREGVKNMAKAFTLQLNSPKKSSIVNVKSGFKECTQIMCNIEAQLENMLGTFHCELQGLVGFARMMPGDVYEVILRHGHQKWKSKGKIGINTQAWDHNTFVFKAMVGDVFNIKASELKTVKSVTLGHKNCEIKDLFSSHPQMMTVSLNTNGSIKLSLVVTWNPLDGVDDNYFVNDTSAVPKRRVQSMYVTSLPRLPYYVPHLVVDSDIDSDSDSETSDSLSDLSSDVSSNEDPNSRHFPMPNYGFHTHHLSPNSQAQQKDLEQLKHSYSKCGSVGSRPKSVAIMGTINESSTDYGGVNNQNVTTSADHSSLNHSYSSPEHLRYSTPDLGLLNFHNLGSGQSDLSGRSHSTSSFSPELPLKSKQEQLGPPTQHIIKRPLVRTSSKFIELGPSRNATKSSFSNDISMYTPQSLSEYEVVNSNTPPRSPRRENHPVSYNGINNIATNPAVLHQHIQHHHHQQHHQNQHHQLNHHQQNLHNVMYKNGNSHNIDPSLLVHGNNSNAPSPAPSSLSSDPPVSVYSPKSYAVNTSPNKLLTNPHYNPALIHQLQHHQHQHQVGGLKSPPPAVPSRSPRLLTSHMKHSKSNPYDMRQLSNNLVVEGAFPATSVGGGKFPGMNAIENALLSLRTTLEDYQGQYPELQKLEEQVHYLDRMLKKNNPNSPTSDDVGISIEDALNAFDFLETEYYIDGYGSSGTSRQSSYEQLENKCNSLSPESTAKTSDSGIECLATRLTEDHPTSPDIQTTGNEQVDRTMTWHLHNCERLLGHVGNFGPLKCKEMYSLEKLGRQADVIEHLMKTARQFPGQIRDLQTVMSDLTSDMEMKKFWVRCTDHHVLFTSPERFLAQLERSYGEFIRQKYDITSILVFKTLVARILELPYFEPGMMRPSPIVTLHQVMSYFNHSDKKGLPDNLQHLAGELWLMHRLQSGNTDVIVQTLLTFRSTLPPKQCLLIVAVLLVCENMDVRNNSANYLQSVCAKEGLRKQAIVVYVEGLEEKNIDVRSGSCVALKLLQAIESVDQLVYISTTDHSLIVQQRAKEGLLAFGEHGRKAYLNSQLASHGFQAVNVRL